MLLDFLLAYSAGGAVGVVPCAVGVIAWHVMDDGDCGDAGQDSNRGVSLW